MTDQAIDPQLVFVDDASVGGWHKFTSSQVPGFYIVAPDGDVDSAYADIPRAIELLYLRNRQQKVQVRFDRVAEHGPQSAVRQYSVVPVSS
jgi:hypothetical protein